MMETLEWNVYMCFVMSFLENRMCFRTSSNVKIGLLVKINSPLKSQVWGTFLDNDVVEDYGARASRPSRLRQTACAARW